MRFKVCLCAIIKDELDLEEWVVYNHLIGFEHIFIYDNNSQVPIRSRLNKYRSLVTVIDFPMTGTLTQRAAYNHFRVNLGPLTEWVAFFDADEYLVLKKHKTVKNLLDDFKDCDGLAIHWMMFGPNGHKKRPKGLVIENYITRAMSHDDHGKSIVKLNSIIKCEVHTHTMKKGSKYVDALRNSAAWPSKVKDQKVTDIVQLNHYVTRSTEDWDHRLIRGQISNGTKSWHKFNQYKKICTIRDQLIINQGYAKKIKKFIAIRTQLNDSKIKNNMIAMGPFILPTDFNWRVYLYLNLDVAEQKCSEDSAINHWIKYGHQEGRPYKYNGPDFSDFDWKFYIRTYNDLQNSKVDTQEKAFQHFLIQGLKENRKYHP